MECGICLDRLLVAGGRRPDTNSSSAIDTAAAAAAADIVCTECGHTFHRACLRRWLPANSRHSGTCPTCRMPCRVAQLRKIYGSAVASAGRSPAAPARRACQCRRCPTPRAGKIWCPWHLECGPRCRTAAAGLCWLASEPNGLLYCQRCCRMRCTLCGRLIVVRTEHPIVVGY